MFEREIKLYEPGELMFFILVSAIYYLGVNKYNFFERFDYDINVFVIVLIICLILGLKRYTANGRGISKTYFFLPIQKKPKHGVRLNTWLMSQPTRRTGTEIYFVQI